VEDVYSVGPVRKSQPPITGQPMSELLLYIQVAPGGKVNMLEGHSIGQSKQKLYMCLIPNGLRHRAISLYRRATRHVLTRAAKCIDVDGGIFENVLHWVNCTNFAT
jgi:hypothetical protein